MNKTTLQFESLVHLAAFMENMELMNFEINYNALTISCELDQETIDKAIHDFHASILEQEVLD